MASLLDGFQKNLNISKDLFLEEYEGYSLSAFNSAEKVLNFSPGPTALPENVMKFILQDLINNWVLGVTPLEISHRSPEFLEIKNNCERLFRELLDFR